MRKLVYYVAVSIDGYIAGQSGSTAGLSSDPDYVTALAELLPETIPGHLRGLLGVTEPARRFDTVLMGRNTHQLAVDAGLTSGYPHLDQHVFTTHDDLPVDPTVTLHDGDPVAVVRALKAQPGRDLWMCGGGHLAGQLLTEIDELILKVSPVALGRGVPLFGSACAPVAFHLGTTRFFDNGVVMLSYQRRGCMVGP